MIDTHCHLTDPRIAEQLPAVLQRAKAAGVDRIVTIGTHRDDWGPTLAVCHRRDNVRWSALGVHPNYCNQADLADLTALRPLLDLPVVAAVGEMGLDYHYGDVPKARQAEFFRAQLQMARQVGKPVVIHCREAVEDALAVLGDFPGISAVFHCFTGEPEEAGRVIDAGYYLGFTGVVTYKNAPKLRQIAAEAPGDRILVETDGPYLAPEPMRKQKINEPALVVHTAAAVAAARGVTLGEIDRITTENAERFYRWVGA